MCVRAYLLRSFRQQRRKDRNEGLAATRARGTRGAPGLACAALKARRGSCEEGQGGKAAEQNSARKVAPKDSGSLACRETRID
mmetsp:Transcript_9591/g.16851  ORF Transcript_9591/g.16851 Transcript_9591/m.16851 type:complete len:83 (+) Transcript_9591:241-489(+)